MLPFGELLKNDNPRDLIDKLYFEQALFALAQIDVSLFQDFMEHKDLTWFEVIWKDVHSKNIYVYGFESVPYTHNGYGYMSYHRKLENRRLQMLKIVRRFEVYSVTLMPTLIGNKREKMKEYGVFGIVLYETSEPEDEKSTFDFFSVDTRDQWIREETT